MVQGLFISVVVHFLVVKSWSPTTTEQERGGTTLPGKRIGFRGIAVRVSVSTSEDGLKFADFLENKLRNFYGFFLLSFNTNNSIEIQINFTWYFYVVMLQKLSIIFSIFLNNAMIQASYSGDLKLVFCMTHVYIYLYFRVWWSIKQGPLTNSNFFLLVDIWMYMLTTSIQLIECKT